MIRWSALLQPPWISLAIAVLLPLTVSAQVVRIETLPEPGMQPQVAVSSGGVVHLVYLLGEPGACDVRYTNRPAKGGAWTAPVTVNSEPGTAIATGTIRGAQLALGKGDSVQVVWNGSTGGKKERMMHAPLFHARLVPGAKTFSRQQNLSGDTTALDGGASIAADGRGTVSLVWHATPSETAGESTRLVYERRSMDDGGTFAAQQPLNTEKPGVCACCSLRAHLAADGTLTVLYRNMSPPASRGMTLLTRQAGRTRLTRLDDWQAAMCPMSSASLMPSGQGLLAAWENEGRISTGIVGGTATAVQRTGPANARHPALARNEQGWTLITSVVGTGWNKAGTLHWDLMNAAGRITASGSGVKLPTWSFPAAHACPDGSFVVLQ
ncbi:MAG: hypothetical protein CJBNEKGG_03846 [Prosthecobacter sp.]|nr:hypothetical protein [Prosthecobacter sp.]